MIFVSCLKRFLCSCWGRNVWRKARFERWKNLCPWGDYPLVFNFALWRWKCHSCDFWKQFLPFWNYESNMLNLIIFSLSDKKAPIDQALRDEFIRVLTRDNSLPNLVHVLSTAMELAMKGWSHTWNYLRLSSRLKSGLVSRCKPSIWCFRLVLGLNSLHNAVWRLRQQHDRQMWRDFLLCGVRDPRFEICKSFAMLVRGLFQRLLPLN